MRVQTNAKKQKHLLLILTLVLVAVAVVFVVVVPSCQFFMMMTGTYDVDTVTFKLTDPATATSGADGSREPSIWIETNISHDLWQKKIQSSKPYSIAIDKADTSFTYASAVFTKVQITYDDGTVETSKPSLPFVMTARAYTATNSVSGGQIVKTKMRVISGKISDVITRDEPFTLQLEGYFTLDDGSQIPFKINQHYDVEIEQSKQPASGVMQDM
jgi:hypothetical protein